MLRVVVRRPGSNWTPACPGRGRGVPAARLDAAREERVLELAEPGCVRQQLAHGDRLGGRPETSTPRWSPSMFADGSSSVSVPSATSWSTTVPVITLEMLAMRKRSDASTGSSTMGTVGGRRRRGRRGRRRSSPTTRSAVRRRRHHVRRVAVAVRTRRGRVRRRCSQPRRRRSHRTRAAGRGGSRRRGPTRPPTGWRACPRGLAPRSSVPSRYVVAAAVGVPRRRWRTRARPTGASSSPGASSRGVVVWVQRLGSEAAQAAAPVVTAKPPRRTRSAVASPKSWVNIIAGDSPRFRVAPASVRATGPPATMSVRRR